MNKLAAVAVVLIVIGVIMSCGALFGAGMFMPAQNAAEMSHTVTEVSSDVNHTASLLGIMAFGALALVGVVVAVVLFGTGSKIQVGGQGNHIGDVNNQNTISFAPWRRDVLEHAGEGADFDTLNEVIPWIRGGTDHGRS